MLRINGKWSSYKTFRQTIRQSVDRQIFEITKLSIKSKMPREDEGVMLQNSSLRAKKQLRTLRYNLLA